MTAPRQSLPASFANAVCGIVAAVRLGRNIKIQLAFALLAIACSALLGLTLWEWCLIAVLIAIVIASELVNTAVEAAVDLACPGIDPKAKLAKDASAGAVLVLSVASALIGLAVFINAALRLLGAGGC